MKTTKKDLWLPWAVGEERQIGAAQRIFRQLKYSVQYYNEGYMPLCIFPNP